MQKRWQSVKFKAQNRRRVERSLKKVRERKRRGNVPNSEERAVFGEGVYKPVKAPANLSFVGNGVETAAFFDVLEKRLLYKQPTFIELGGVQEITPDAILYMLSLFDVYGQQGSVKVRGNRPGRSQPNELLEVSGFFDFVSTREPVLHRSKKILSIRTGELVAGDVAEEVIEFACRHLNLTFTPF